VERAEQQTNIAYKMETQEKLHKPTLSMLTKRGRFGILTKLSLRQPLRQGAAEKQSRDLKKSS
jgi:hypothetical protein